MKPYEWRKAITKSGLKPTTRHVLLTMACYLNDGDDSVFPSTKTLAEDTGLSERAVITHIHEAAEAGWIKINKLGANGQAWARNCYQPAIPDGFSTSKGTEQGSAPLEEKALNDVPKALNVVPKALNVMQKALNDVQSNKPLEESIEETKEIKNTERATRLPKDWEPTEADVLFCKTDRPDLNVLKVAAEFRDYWTALPDNLKAKKTDWPATWRNWVRRQHQQPARAAPYQSQQDKAKTFADRVTGKTRNAHPDIIDITPANPRELDRKAIRQDAPDVWEEVHGPMGRG